MNCGDIISCFTSFHPLPRILLLDPHFAGSLTSLSLCIGRKSSALSHRSDHTYAATQVQANAQSPATEKPAPSRKRRLKPVARRRALTQNRLRVNMLIFSDVSTLPKFTIGSSAVAIQRNKSHQILSFWPFIPPPWLSHTFFQRCVWFSLNSTSKLHQITPSFTPSNT